MFYIIFAPVFSPTGKGGFRSMHGKACHLMSAHCKIIKFQHNFGKFSCITLCYPSHPSWQIHDFFVLLPPKTSCMKAIDNEE